MNIPPQGCILCAVSGLDSARSCGSTLFNRHAERILRL